MLMTYIFLFIYEWVVKWYYIVDREHQTRGSGNPDLGVSQVGIKAVVTKVSPVSRRAVGYKL